MSKNALGSIPIFENVAGSTTTIKQDLDLFKTDAKEEPKKEVKEDKEKKVKEDLKKQLLAQVGKEREEAKLEINKASRQVEKKIIKELKEAEEKSLEEPKNNKEKPSTKKGLKAGYKRQTFVIREDLLEIIQALSSTNKEVSQANILEALIEKGLEDIKEEVKEKALASYRRQQQEPKEEKAKISVAKLFN